MATFIYIPVATPEMLEIARQWNAGRQVQNRMPYEVIANDTEGGWKAIRRAIGTGLLERVDPGDKLYVLSHGILPTGSRGAANVGNKRGGVLEKTMLGGLQVIGGTYKLYNDATFARHLEKEGLSKDFVDLRLFCCCSGLEAKHKGNVLSPYALRLRNALANRGYQAVRVTGYLGNLSPYSYYYRSGTVELIEENTRGMGPTIDVDGERAPMYFKDHAVTFR